MVRRLSRFLWSLIMATFCHSDREPISTYEQAVWRLCQLFVLESPGFDAAVQIVADIFWFKESYVSADVRAARRSICLPPSSLLRHSSVPL